MGENYTICVQNRVKMSEIEAFRGERRMTESGVRLRINGEERTVRARTVAELVNELGLDGRMIAVERNLEVVPKSAYAQTRLVDGDRLEIVHMIGGG